MFKLDKKRVCLFFENVNKLNCIFVQRKIHRETNGFQSHQHFSPVVATSSTSIDFFFIFFFLFKCRSQHLIFSSVFFHVIRMASSTKRVFVDRDDFDADHYADCIRDLHRSRITLDQLDIARRQLRKKENLLSRTHQLKMKEHIRVKNEFIRKVEKDTRISNLSTVKETLKAQQRSQQSVSPPPPQASIEIVETVTNSTEEQDKSAKTPIKGVIEPYSSQQQRLRANIEKFNHQNPFVV